MDTCLHQLPASIENSNKGAGHQHGEDPDHRGIADTDHGHEFDSLLHPAVFSRAVIKAYYGLGPLGKSIDRDA